MNNEIKEINIKIPGQILDYVDTKDHLLDLFNYITNLQQENYELKYINYGDNKITIEDCINEMNNTINDLIQENERLKEENIILKASEPMSKIAEDYGYKSRCEKAIKYIDTNFCIENRRDLKEVVNILQNGSE